MINETSKVLKGAIDSALKTEIPDEMLRKLKNDVFVFSGMKTYTQLKEASALLFDEKGNIKSEAKFIHDIKKIDSTYNENYLRVERQYAIAATESAAQYHEYMQDAERYDLQVRTANDDKVRQKHAAWHDLTLPADHSFWNSNWTPFDWGCRCRIIQVLKGKYAHTDIDTANKVAKDATGEIFRYNPGREGVVFPPKHPYYKMSKQALSTMKEEAEKIEDNGKSVDLNKHIKKDKVSAKVLNDIMMDYANSHPEHFRYGLEKVNVTRSSSYFMQHSKVVNSLTGETIGKSTINVSNAGFSSSFRPAKNLMDGLVKIKKKEALTFDEEYAFESLWHEILHAETATKRFSLSRLQKEHMETVNQFVARHTYPEFMKAFGGEAKHQSDILDKGHGYRSWITNFRNKLSELGISEQDAVEYLRPHLMADYSNLGSKMKGLFSDLGKIEPE